MNIREADKKLVIIERLAREIEDDIELRNIDIRYSILAKWINTEIDDID